MRLRSVVERVLPLDKERGEKRLSREARAVVFRGMYIDSSRVVDIAYSPEAYFPRYAITGQYALGPQGHAHARTHVRRQVGSTHPDEQLGNGIRNEKAWRNGLPWDAMNELADPAAIQRASHVEHLAKRVKAGLALAAVLIGGGLAAAELATTSHHHEEAPVQMHAHTASPLAPPQP